jgi:hypothetical protein
MRTIAIGEGKPLKVSMEQRARLKERLQNKHKSALQARAGWENICRQCIRMYQGTPDENNRWRPFENAPVIEVTIGAMACDTVISQAEDLIFQVKPPLTIRSRKGEFDDAAEAVQDLVNHGVESGFWNFEAGVKEALIDQVQMGTVVGYIPYTKTVRKTDVREVVTFGPKIYCLAPEDFIIPANATKNIQSCEFATMRMWMGKDELNLRARLNNWTVDDAAAPDTSSAVRADRMRAAGVSGGSLDTKPPVVIGDTFIYFDIDDDGIEEDLEVIWNMTSGNILKVMYNRYDSRPFVLECYQDRAHTAFGLGVLEMMIPFEREVTEIHNNHIWNMMLANTKMYQGPSTGMQETTSAYPGKYLINDEGPQGEIKVLDMGEVNGTAIQAESVVTAMGRERVGTTQISAPIRSSSRTPGISMLSMMQQANRRFTHPFNNMRNFGAQVVMHCLYRLQEQVRAGNKDVKKKLKEILGDDKAEMVVDLFKSSDVELTDALDIQLTASSVSVNRESDRQNMVMLATQIYPVYFAAMKELAQFIAQPPFPGADKVAKQAEKMINKFFGKVLKTFDQISDVRSLQVDLDEIQPMMQQLGMEQVPGQINGALTQMSQPNGAAPGGAPPQGQPIH